MPCSQYEAMFLSAAHTEADVAATVAAAKESLCDVAS
jgi:glutamate-1-semialdehyde aminotransferase